MDGNDLIKASKVLNPNLIIPIHYRGWSHFKENEKTLKKIIAANDSANRKTLFLTSGLPTTVN
jgi:L-ascorbate metabolism protein UlaG (beta-lactamase superfamily)